MKRSVKLVLPIVLLVLACTDGENGTTGGMFQEEPTNPCRGRYDSVYDACIEKLSQSCIGLECLFIFGECHNEAIREAAICCHGSQACIDSLPGVTSPGKDGAATRLP